MAVDLANYVGREQAYVKHYLLDIYLEALIHKIASRYDHVVYVDGFSGPWQAAGTDFQDTSFGIALRALRSAKTTWDARRTIRMTAHLVEKSERAFQELAKLPERYPDIEIIPHHGDFVAIAEALARQIPRNAFVFLFIDPKGWRINIGALQYLLRMPNCEVLFNFMFEFINRAASMRDPMIMRGLDELIPTRGWRERLAAEGAVISPADRKRILVDAFATSIREIGRYGYVADTSVLRPLRDREIYSLVYATRRSPGIEVFRDCQVKTLREQSAMRGAAKSSAQSTTTGQVEAFTFSEMSSDGTEAFLANEAVSAKQLLLHLTPPAPQTILYGNVWPQVLSHHAIRKTELGRMAATLRASGELLFPDWPPRKQVPDDSYRMSRRAQLGECPLPVRKLGPG